MQKIQLYIDGQRVDFFKDEAVVLTQTLKNVKDIAKVFTEFTQTFSVPASKPNNIIFQHYYNFDIFGGFDARQKVEANIDINNLPFRNGKIRLDGVDLKNNIPHTYRITFFGATSNLKDLLGNEELSSLSFATNQNKPYTFSEVVNRLQFVSNDILAPLITHTNRLIYDSTSHTQYDITATTNNISHHGAGTTNQNGVSYNQFKYAIRLQSIISAIEEKYNIEFSDDFFNDNTNEKFYNLFMWLHRKEGSIEPNEQVEYSWTKLNDLVVAPLSDERVSSVSNGIINVNEPPFLTATGLQVSITPLNALNSYSVQVIRDGGIVIASFNEQTGPLNFTLGRNNSGFQNNSTYFLQFSSQLGNSFSASNIDINIPFLDSSFGGSNGTDRFTNSASFITTPTFEFNVVEQIPKMKIIDFLSGLFNMFNLVAYADNLGKIVVIPLDEYYAATPGFINIDKYLDTTKSKVDVALPFSKINFSYKGLGSFLANQFNKLFNAGWGSLSYSLDGTIYDAPNEEYKVEVPYEHFMYERLYDAGYTTPTSTSVQWGYSVNENEQPYIGEPLLFYAIKIENGNSIRIRNTITGTKFDINDYYIPSNSLDIAPTSSKINIHFQNELNEYLANEQGGEANDFTDTLFESEYKTYIQDVFSLRSRITKVTAFLPFKIFYNLTLSNNIQLGQQTYKINSIKTNLITGKTDFELINS